MALLDNKEDFHPYCYLLAKCTFREWTDIKLWTLSKILCKWKQDSAVSLFLYLDSVFKNNYKLIHNQAPVMNRLCPFLLNLHKWKINGLFDCIIRREWKLWFRVLSDFSIQVFNEICSIDYFSDFQRELEENSQIIPIVSPWKYSVRTLSDATSKHV